VSSSLNQINNAMINSMKFIIALIHKIFFPLFSACRPNNMTNTKPSLFGLDNSNRDFTKKKTWGKNQFNSSFPTSLCCYLFSKEIEANYLCIKNSLYSISTISIHDTFGINPLDKDIFFSFESQFSPFSPYVIGTLPNTDLVIQNKKTKTSLRGLEIKLTALPDQTTFNLSEQKYGSEIVVRPDTIVYLACSISSALTKVAINSHITNLFIKDWTDAQQVLPHVNHMINAIHDISILLEDKQQPFLLQPIWKTQGKSPILAKNCLDVFIWSDAGFCHFISSINTLASPPNGISRLLRTIVWLYKMLLEYSSNNKFNHKNIINNLTYFTKNDKAFASSGNITNPYMTCSRLTIPIIKKNEIKNIILGNGQNLLSPERRFDAIITHSPELFK
jgi:hypothetical protein